MTTKSAPRVPLGWFVATVAGVALIFLSGYLIAGGSSVGLLVMGACTVGFLAGRVSSLSTRRRPPKPPVRGWTPPPPRRAPNAPTRQGRPPVPVGDNRRR
jgi:hypothetical protein